MPSLRMSVSQKIQCWLEKVSRDNCVVVEGRGQDRNCQGGKLSFRAVVVGVRTWPEFSSATNFDFTYSYFSRDKTTFPGNQFFLWCSNEPLGVNSQNVSENIFKSPVLINRRELCQNYFVLFWEVSAYFLNKFNSGLEMTLKAEFEFPERRRQSSLFNRSNQSPTIFLHVYMCIQIYSYLHLSTDQSMDPWI